MLRDYLLIFDLDFRFDIFWLRSGGCRAWHFRDLVLKSKYWCKEAEPEQDKIFWQLSHQNSNHWPTTTFKSGREPVLIPVLPDHPWHSSLSWSSWSSSSLLWTAPYHPHRNSSLSRTSGHSTKSSLIRAELTSRSPSTSTTTLAMMSRPSATRARRRRRRCRFARKAFRGSLRWRCRWCRWCRCCYCC